MLTPPVFMLAADHRWQWDDWCDANQVARARIALAKEVALDGLLEARRTFPGLVDAGAALLVDRQYGGAVLKRAADAKVIVGTPAEKPGVFPLGWTADPFSDALGGDFAKVLIRYRPEWTAEALQSQLAKLRELAGWCREHRTPLVLEVIVPREHEPEEAFEAEGRPALLARVMAECYHADVIPVFWKIEGTTSPRAMRVIDEAVARHPSPRLLILGKGAGFDTIEAWFAAAAAARTAAGFAIGRSVYWQPAVDLLQGRCDRPAAVEAIARNYLRVVESWRRHVTAITNGERPAV